jgi:hypothetical protein
MQLVFTEVCWLLTFLQFNANTLFVCLFVQRTPNGQSICDFIQGTVSTLESEYCSAHVLGFFERMMVLQQAMKVRVYHCLK